MDCFDKITVKEDLWKRLEEDKRPIHLVLIATKPDIIKQAPLIIELKNRGENMVIVHSGQHYDWNLSKGMEAEFDIVPDINLNVSGKLYEQQSQIIDRLGQVIDKIKKIDDWFSKSFMRYFSSYNVIVAKKND